MDSVSVTISTTEDGITVSAAVAAPLTAQDAAVIVLGQALAKALVTAWAGSLTNAGNILDAARKELDDMAENI